jgi:hypothetical protein
MKMTKQLADLISNHLKTIDEIDYINHGGCGYVAISIYNMFVRLGFKPQIYQIDYNYRKTLKKYNLNNRRINREYAEVAAHYVVRVGNYLFDSSGATDVGPDSSAEIRDFESWSYNKTPIYKSDLIWALKYGAWNNFFKDYHHGDKAIIRRINNHIRSFNQDSITQ